MSCLIIFKSVTYAQSALFLLSKNGIVSYVTRPPASLGAGSCSYGLKVSQAYAQKAAELIKRSNIPVVAVYTTLPNGDYRRVE